MSDLLFRAKVPAGAQSTGKGGTLRVVLENRFILSVAAILFFTASAKCISALGSGEVLRSVDPLFGLPVRTVMLWISAGEIGIAAFLLSRAKPVDKHFLILWFSAIAITYRIFAHYTIPDHPCPCLGTLPGALGLNPPIVQLVLMLALGYLVSGSLGLLLAMRFCRPSVLAVAGSGAAGSPGASRKLSCIKHLVLIGFSASFLTAPVRCWSLQYAIDGTVTYEVNVLGKGFVPTQSRFSLVVEECQWSIDLYPSSSTDIELFHLGYDGTNIIYYFLPRAKTTTNYSAMVEAGPVPSRWTSLPGESVWLAFASSCYFSPQRRETARSLMPLRLSPYAFARIDRPCQYATLGAPPYLLEQFELVYTNIPVLDKTGKQLSIPLPACFTNGYIGARYQCGEVTNVYSLSIPISFDYSDYAPLRGAKTDKDLFCTARVHGEVTQISTTEQHPRTELPGSSSVVQDFRSPSGPPPIYTVRNGKIPPPDDPQIRTAQGTTAGLIENTEKLRAARDRQRAKRSRAFLSVLAAASVLPVFYFFAVRKR